MSFASVARSLLFVFILLIAKLGYGQCEVSSQVMWGISDGSSSIRARHAAFTVQKDLLVCGQSNNSGIVVHFNRTSSVRWAKTFSLLGSSVNFQKVIALSGGDMIAIGYGSEINVSFVVVVRLDTTGNIIWSRKLYDLSLAMTDATGAYLIVEGVGETPDGGIVSCGYKRYSLQGGVSNYRSFIFKLTANGSVVWTREDTNGNDDEYSGLLVEGNQIIAVGSSNVSSLGARYGVLAEYNHVDGALLSVRHYKVGGTSSNWLRSIEKINNGYEIGAQGFNQGSAVYSVIRTNVAGDVSEMKQLPVFGPAGFIDQYYYPVPLADGSSVVWKNKWYSATDVQIGKISQARTADWHYQYTRPGLDNIYKVLPFDQNSVLAVGQGVGANGQERIYLLKPKSNGTTEGCANDVLPFSISNLPANGVTGGSWKTTALNFQAPLDLDLTSRDVSLTPTILCESNAQSCQINNLIGDKIICTPDTTVHYKVQLNGSCANTIKWSLSQPIGVLQQLNDSVVAVRFTQAGTAMLKAEVATCPSLMQQIQLQYRPTTNTLNLGLDASICSGDTLTLQATNSYHSIQWNNGSTRNSIQVTSGGNYSVKVSNDGVCFLQDTVAVVIHPKPLLQQLPKNPVICLPDAINLNAGPGFTQYLWQDGSNEPTYKVQSMGVYWVQVKDRNGCVNADTVFVTKQGNKPAAFASFADTTICFGETVTLRLNTAFTSYNWNNGQSFASAYSVNRPGIYEVTVETTEGCVGKDLIAVKDKGCTQALYVPTAFTPNKDGKNDIFKAVAVGIIESFELQVFNRWGEHVYHSNDIQHGWDGRSSGLTQSTNTFAWVARYRFAGDKEWKTQKGTVTLIR